MTDFEAIKARISRRNYLDTPIEPQKVDRLQAEITRCNTESGLSFYYVEDGSAAFASAEKTYGYFVGVRSMIVLRGPKADPHLEEKCGYYGERIVIEATKLGLGTCWVCLTFDKECGLFHVRGDEALVGVITVGHAPPEPSEMEAKIRARAREASKTGKDMYRSTRPVPTWFEQAMERVQYAPSGKNTQKAVFCYGEDGITAEIPGDGPYDLTDLGIAKLHFELGADGRFAFGNPGRFVREL